MNSYVLIGQLIVFIAYMIVNIRFLIVHHFFNSPNSTHPPVLCSDKSIETSVLRVINIWEERKVFEKDFLQGLRSRLGRFLLCAEFKGFSLSSFAGVTTSRF